ncbi:MAG: hypothetical protein AAGA96_15355 [Verrucomicrobiota bacterium]
MKETPLAGQDTAIKAKQLINEYRITASRAGCKLDAALLTKVLNALVSQAKGEQIVLQAAFVGSSTVQVLVESLYQDILELRKPASDSLSENLSDSICLLEWLRCLNSLVDSISLPDNSLTHVN